MDGGTDLRDVRIGHDVGDFLGQAEFVETEQEGFRLAGELQERRVMPRLMSLEHGLGLRVETDEALGREVLDGVGKVASGAGDDVDLAREGGQFELFDFFGRYGLLEHRFYLSVGAISA